MPNKESKGFQLNFGHEDEYMSIKYKLKATDKG